MKNQIATTPAGLDAHGNLRQQIGWTPDPLRPVYFLERALERFPQTGIHCYTPEFATLAPAMPGILREQQGRWTAQTGKRYTPRAAWLLYLKRVFVSAHRVNSRSSEYAFRIA